MQRLLALVLVFLVGSQPALLQAQQFNLSSLPQPGAAVAVSNSFEPVLVKGMLLDPTRPLQIRFVVDSGNDAPSPDHVKREGERMVRYFLAAVTMPEADLWVNLSPYEHERMIAEELGQTDLGRDMLAQDYVLKQLAASSMDPESGAGKAFWDGVYSRAEAGFGAADIPLDAFSKVWIMPDKAEVFEQGNAVYVTKAHLKVMLESDYLAASKASGSGSATASSADSGIADGNAASERSKQILREVLIPALEKEVNEGRNFATMRQIFYAAILAKWYRQAVQDSLLAQAYVGQKKVAGVDVDDKTIKEQIYKRYVEAYKKGVINQVREIADPVSGELIPRKYFSGGEVLAIPRLDKAQKQEDVRQTGRTFVMDSGMKITDAAMTDSTGRQVPVQTVSATVGEIQDISSVHSAAWRDNQSLQLPDAVLQKLIRDGGVLLLKDKDGDRMTRGVLLTHRMKLGQNVHNLAELPLWNNMVAGRESLDGADSVFFWAIGVPPEKGIEGFNLGQEFASQAYQHFNNAGYARIRTFSPIIDKVFDGFKKQLAAQGFGQDVIEKYGIYLYLVADAQQGPIPYIKFIKEHGFVRPEQFFKDNKMKYKDPVENFHVGRNGATIGEVMEHVDGHTRPDSQRTVSYVYKEPGVLDDTVFKSLAQIDLPEDMAQKAAGETVNGGIDIQNIDVARAPGSGGARFAFDAAALDGIGDAQFGGFSPVIISLAPAENPLSALGIK
ncbi:MAG: hypothetical protein HGA80_04160 [Candidatus Omnitrophica bacterium]|nr:hypothetical protein [Candidatus Omnitrophota bacterium]